MDCSIISLSEKHQTFRLNLARLIARDLGKVLYRDKYRKKPGIVAVFHEAPASRLLTVRLVRRLLELGEIPHVLSDRPDRKPIEHRPHPSLIEGDRRLTEEEIRRVWGASGISSSYPNKDTRIQEAGGKLKKNRCGLTDQELGVRARDPGRGPPGSS